MWSLYFELLESLYYPLPICMSFLTNYILSILITVMVGFSLVPIPSWPLQGSIEMVDAALGPVWALFSALPKRYTDTPPGKFSHWLQPAGEVGLFLLPQIRWFHDLINARCGCSTIPSQPQTPGRPHAWAEHPQRSASSTTSGYPHWHIFMCLCCILLPLMPPFSLSPPSRASRLPEANPYSSVVTVGQHCSKHFVAIHCIEQAGLRKWYQKCTFTLRSIVYFHLLRGGSLLGWKLSLHSSSAHSSVTKSTTVLKLQTVQQLQRSDPIWYPKLETWHSSLVFPLPSWALQHVWLLRNKQGGVKSVGGPMVAMGVTAQISFRRTCCGEQYNLAVILGEHLHICTKAMLPRAPSS